MIEITKALILLAWSLTVDPSATMCAARLTGIESALSHPLLATETTRDVRAMLDRHEWRSCGE